MTRGLGPDKVIPQCRGLPGRDSLDAVSPLLAGCRLQREGKDRAGVRKEKTEKQGVRER